MKIEYGCKFLIEGNEIKVYGLGVQDLIKTFPFDEDGLGDALLLAFKIFRDMEPNECLVFGYALKDQ